ncbi:carbohydrate ABC transporter permease [Microbaculum marinisediminis]|uniref:Sugar ABC transporter permease n=1 Tax=Microbaculum marinisediminis TaxID=2931392 RepID=A0AAW5QTG1_9HYPH|nr:sugar ABC transporter permease [Microbaculum sp. A6E488]MCT8971391.1 sugar ABC transporter permease [Microbaculum sp. A6E488]
MYQIKRDFGFFLALVLPAVTIVGLLIIYPVINGVYLSFTDASPLRRSVPQFVGFENYTYLLEDDVFFASAFSTSYIVFVSSVLAVMLGFMMALLLHFGIRRGATVLRSLVFQIWVVPWICITLLWGWMFNKDYGLVNSLITASGLTERNADLLFDATGAKWVIIAGFTWRSIPFLMVIALAALQSISKEVLDAAELDGAGFFSRLRHVVVPMVRNVLMVALLLDAVRFFQEMTMPLVLTQGGPSNATMVLSLFTYKLAFENWDFALASAAGTLWLAFLMLIAWAFLKFGIKKEYGK